MNIYLDESGDLGWNFDQPYLGGGSSQYLTIAYVILSDESKGKYLIREIKNTYSKFGFDTSKETKGRNLRDDQRVYFLNKVIKLLTSHNDIKIGAITVKKARVYDYIRADCNKLYNYMIRKGIAEHVKDCSTEIKFVRDEKSVKVKSGNSLIDYLQTELWFEEGSRAKIIDYPTDSKKSKKILFVDWLSHTIWCKYEFGTTSFFDIIKDYLDSKTFLF